ncbi:hypothetical protein RF11_04900 [Thelohanellus kitauei]|uniref:Uncharacterized protein n=1 Tax=Thelohanellus kitauei TaxID=669202 RepID=A0A0C2ID80_THEKT|nr:hypothetical protein RF11_04900 [Thelohanellus kitauei]
MVFLHFTKLGLELDETDRWKQFRFPTNEDLLIFNEVNKQLKNGFCGLEQEKWWLVEFLNCPKKIKVAPHIFDDANFLYKITTYFTIIPKVYLVVCKGQMGLTSLNLKYIGTEPPQRY